MNKITDYELELRDRYLEAKEMEYEAIRQQTLILDLINKYQKDMERIGE